MSWRTRAQARAEGLCGPETGWLDLIRAGEPEKLVEPAGCNRLVRQKKLTGRLLSSRRTPHLGDRQGAKAEAVQGWEGGKTFL